MLSGIGPAAHLREIGIKCVVDLPVGKNLQDHLGAYMTYARGSPGSFHREMRFDRMAVSMIRAYLFGTGPGDRGAGRAACLHQDAARARGARHRVHVPRHFASSASVVSADLSGVQGRLRHPADAAASRQPRRGPAALQPIRAIRPRIRYNFFTAPNDLPTLRQGFKLARELVYQQALDPYRGKELNPGDKVQSDAEIDTWLRKTVITAHHPCGTCPMGTTPDTVLDPQMRVRGVEQLRVVDASAMPDLVGAHINACVLMMAEKASDMIRNCDPLPAALDA